MRLLQSSSSGGGHSPRRRFHGADAARSPLSSAHTLLKREHVVSRRNGIACRNANGSGGRTMLLHSLLMLLLIVLGAIVIVSILAPLEALGWWAGWSRRERY